VKDELQIDAVGVGQQVLVLLDQGVRLIARALKSRWRR